MKVFICNPVTWAFVAVFGMCCLAIACKPVRGKSDPSKPVVFSVGADNMPNGDSNNYYWGVYLLKYDGKEYLVNSRGGIIEHTRSRQP